MPLPRGVIILSVIFFLLLFRLAEDLMKDINNMLSDFSSELDSMFE